MGKVVERTVFDMDPKDIGSQVYGKVVGSDHNLINNGRLRPRSGRGVATLSCYVSRLTTGKPMGGLKSASV